MIATVIRCDCGCGVERKETNHWILMWKGKDKISFLHWDKTEAESEGTMHLAGDACVQKVVSQWLTEYKQLTTQPSQAVQHNYEGQKSKEDYVFTSEDIQER